MYAFCTSLNSIIAQNTPAPIPTMNFIINGCSCSIRFVVMFSVCIRSSIRKGSMTVSGVLNMLSSLSIVSALLFPPNASTASGLVPIIMLANRRLVVNGIFRIRLAVAENNSRVSALNMNVSLIAFSEKVSRSRSLSLVVESNTTIARASIASDDRNTSGNFIRASPLSSTLPRRRPASIRSSMSGILSFFPIHEQTTPTNSRTAIAVVIISASDMFSIQVCLSGSQFCRSLSFSSFFVFC